MMFHRPNAGRLAALIALVAATGAAFVGSVGAGSGGAGSGASATGRDGTACKIEVSRQGGSLALTALAHGERSASGEYSLLVSGPGTQIRQGGPFEVAAGRTATLGTVGLSAGRGYDVELELTVKGRTVSCEQRVGGRT